MGRIIRTREAAKALGISIYRINQLINEPCRHCGEVKQWSKGTERVVEFIYGNGCRFCRHTGRRLPIVGRMGKGKRAPYLIDADVLDLPQVKNRVVGYPEGKPRSKEDE